MSVEELKYFFSYTRTDSEFVLQLAKELRAVGANLWLDQLDILAGQHWDRTVEEALKNCKGMIAVLSPDSVGSTNVMDEVSYALNKGKLVVPVLIRSCEIPLRLERLQYADFTADYDTGFSQLLRALGIEQPAQPPESSATREPVVREPSLSKQPESTPDTLDHPKPTGPETKKAPSKRQTAKVLAAICIVTLITIVSIAVFLRKDGDGPRADKPQEDATKEPEPNEPDKGRDRQPEAGDIVTNSIGMKLVYIPAGSFMMGSGDSAAQLAREYDAPESLFTAEFPQHQVHISEGFWMGQTEVTQGQYKSVMNAQPWIGQSFVREDANNPAVHVTWDDANDFCRKLSQQEGKTYRLPTEAEWEYACRASTTSRFSFRDSDSSFDDYAWHRSNAYEVGQAHAHSVGQKKPNPWGLYDMHGNVFEWCSDYHDKDYYSDSPSVDPKGPSSGTTRSARSSSWGDGRYNLRCSYRFGVDPVDRNFDLGFRIVRSPSGPHVEQDKRPERPEVAVEEPVEAVPLPKPDTVKANSIGMKLVYIPAGRFMMGSGDSAAQLAREYDASEILFRDEFPQHQVRISEGFWMGQTEVTQGQYKSVMDAQPWSGVDLIPEDASHPAVCVSWDDAVEFCRKLSQQEGKTYRLPTEAEWEYACRAGTTTRFSFGDSDSTLGDYAWFLGNARDVGQDYAHPVGQKKPNPWSLYDMHGNVWELCSDCYHEDYYSNSPSVDPEGSPLDTYRSVRGGSWLLNKRSLRCSGRLWFKPEHGFWGIGFRVVRSQ